MKKKLTYEDSMLRLQEIISRLEDRDITLEASMKLFEEGVVLIKECGQMLDAAQQKIETLSDSLKTTQETE